MNDTTQLMNGGTLQVIKHDGGHSTWTHSVQITSTLTNFVFETFLKDPTDLAIAAAAANLAVQLEQHVRGKAK